jgi:hypothetical protein
VAHFDRAIPPGGEGKITLTVDLSGYNGPVRKDATVTSNDPEKSSFTLTVRAAVRQMVQVRPGNTISFRGTLDQAKEAIIELIGTAQPFQISKMESNLDGKISYQMQTVTPGQHYQLKVKNLLPEGSYSGYIILTADLPRGKIPTIRVSGRIEGELSVTPKSILMGKTPQQLIESRTVNVRSNSKKPFKITNLNYDANLLKVEAQPLRDKSGYNLEVSVKMPSVPSGNSVETTISVQTDLDPQAKQDIQVRLINQAN